MNHTKETKKLIRTLAKVGLSICLENKTVVDVLWLHGEQETAVEAILDALDPYLRLADDYSGQHEETVEYFNRVLQLAADDEPAKEIEEEDECQHDEHDHGYCLDCGADIMDSLVADAESRYEGDR